VEGVVLEALQGPGDSLDAAGIVRAVEDDQRCLTHDLEATGPVGITEATGQRRLGHVCDLSAQRRRDTGVGRLVFTEQGQIRLDVPAVAVDCDGPFEALATAVFDSDVVVFAADGLDRAGNLTDALPGLAGHGRHQRAVRRRDVGLVPGDFLSRVAEDTGVFERHRRHRARDGVDDAGRVKSPADSDFDDGNVDLLTGKLPVCKRRQRLEQRRCGPIGRPISDVWLDPLDEFDNRGLGDFPAVDTDPLANVVQMWGRVQAHVTSGFPERAFDHACGASLPVRPGDLDAIE